MGSLIEEHKRRAGAARAEADRLRSRIDELSRDLARAEPSLSVEGSRKALTYTVAGVLGEL